jgi:hypothetical protein
VATAALLSAPRIASLRFVRMPLDLHRGGERDGVDVGAEQDRGGAVRPRYARQQVACPRTRLVGGVVLLDVQPERAQLLRHGVGDGALVTGRALDLAEPHELGDQPLALLARRLDDHGRQATPGRLGRNTRPRESCTSS